MKKSFFWVCVFLAAGAGFAFAAGSLKSGEPAVNTETASVTPEEKAARIEAQAKAAVEAAAQVEAEEEKPVEEDSWGMDQSLVEMNMSDAGKVTLNFRDADIKDVLKIFSYKSGMNIVAGPEVVGVVTIELRDVPWQEALDAVLSTYGYGYDQRGSIITVMTIDSLKKSREDARALSEQEPLATETIFLNYGKAEDVLKTLEKMKTGRGSIHFDPRTNAIILNDVASNIANLRNVVKKLDAVTPQVLIEAKIIETTLNKGENMGIDWTVQASLGGASRATSVPFSQKGSSHRFMPAANATDVTPDGSTLGPTITYGTLDFTQMTAVFKMLKTRADTNVLSNPRIVTLDNQPAKITVGSQYPVPTYTYNEQQAKLQVSGWDYLDIGIIFNVTPHVNNAGLVTLDIKPTVTDILDFVTVENTQMPRLSSEEAETRVMIKDGETLIIAGLIKDRTTDTRKKVPFLGDIPILGIPFQKKETSVVKTELIIFLTPHIITPAGSADEGEGATAAR